MRRIRKTRQAGVGRTWEAEKVDETDFNSCNDARTRPLEFSLIIVAKRALLTSSSKLTCSWRIWVSKSSASRLNDSSDGRTCRVASRSTMSSFLKIGGKLSCWRERRMEIKHGNEQHHLDLSHVASIYSHCTRATLRSRPRVAEEEQKSSSAP